MQVISWAFAITTLYHVFRESFSSHSESYSGVLLDCQPLLHIMKQANYVVALMSTLLAVLTLHLYVNSLPIQLVY